jgi:hypothetical protein
MSVVKKYFVQTTIIPKKDIDLTKVVQNSVDALKSVVGPQALYAGMKNYREYDSAVTPIVEVDGVQVNLGLDINGKPIRVKLIMDGTSSDSWRYDMETGVLEIYNMPKKVDQIKNNYWREHHIC